MDKVCVIYDTDEHYAKKLFGAVNSRSGLQFCVQLFTDKEALRRFLQDNKADVIITSELNRFDGQDIENCSRIIMLTEEIGNENLADGDGKIVRVYRYQTFDKIFERILEASELIHKREQNRLRIIGIYSFAGAEQKIAFVLNMARLIASRHRLLYINLEEFSGVNRLLGNGTNEDLSDALYYYKQLGRQSAEKICNMIKKTAGIDYIPSTRCAEDLSDITARQLVELIESISEFNSYEIIILDISIFLSLSWKLMEYCDYIYMPVESTRLCADRVSEFEAYFMGLGMEKVIDGIEKIELPECNIDESFWENNGSKEMYELVHKTCERWQ